jgi:sodium/bile acid cotransporter 7
MPTTIASGITLVAAAHGSTALALMFTILTNSLAVVLLPFTVDLVVETEVEIDSLELLFKLSITVLVPLLVGKVRRDQYSASKHGITSLTSHVGLSLSHAC